MGNTSARASVSKRSQSEEIDIREESRNGVTPTLRPYLKSVKFESMTGLEEENIYNPFSGMDRLSSLKENFADLRSLEDASSLSDNDFLDFEDNSSEEGAEVKKQEDYFNDEKKVIEEKVLKSYEKVGKLMEALINSTDQAGSFSLSKEQQEMFLLNSSSPEEVPTSYFEDVKQFLVARTPNFKKIEDVFFMQHKYSIEEKLTEEIISDEDFEFSSLEMKIKSRVKEFGSEIWKSEHGREYFMERDKYTKKLFQSNQVAVRDLLQEARKIKKKLSTKEKKRSRAPSSINRDHGPNRKALNPMIVTKGRSAGLVSTTSVSSKLVPNFKDLTNKTIALTVAGTKTTIDKTIALTVAGTKTTIDKTKQYSVATMKRTKMVTNASANLLGLTRRAGKRKKKKNNSFNLDVDSFVEDGLEAVSVSSGAEKFESEKNLTLQREKKQTISSEKQQLRRSLELEIKFPNLLGWRYKTKFGKSFTTRQDRYVAIKDIIFESGKGDLTLERNAKDKSLLKLSSSFLTFKLCITGAKVAGTKVNRLDVVVNSTFELYFQENGDNLKLVEKKTKRSFDLQKTVKIAGLRRMVLPAAVIEFMSQVFLPKMLSVLGMRLIRQMFSSLEYYKLSLAQEFMVRLNCDIAADLSVAHWQTNLVSPTRVGAEVRKILGINTEQAVLLHHIVILAQSQRKKRVKSNFSLEDLVALSKINPLADDGIRKELYTFLGFNQPEMIDFLQEILERVKQLNKKKLTTKIIVDDFQLRFYSGTNPDALNISFESFLSCIRLEYGALLCKAQNFAGSGQILPFTRWVDQTKEDLLAGGICLTAVEHLAVGKEQTDVVFHFNDQALNLTGAFSAQELNLNMFPVNGKIGESNVSCSSFHGEAELEFMQKIYQVFLKTIFPDGSVETGSDISEKKKGKSVREAEKILKKLRNVEPKGLDKLKQNKLFIRKLPLKVVISEDTFSIQFKRNKDINTNSAVSIICEQYLDSLIV
eukprot:augustus_masked-scaffold_123-processed-gene-0.12-mRNA-1 protein AED:1.00 eAED:1.00 QI:0/-1/0/0/-1/1/1/0/982